MMKPPNRIGLGTFPFASVFSKVSDYRAKSIVRKFLDLGGFYIDTAPIYGFAQAETLLGRTLQSIPRDKYYIASKCGYVWGSDKKPQLSGKYQDVISEFEKSLRRLNLERIDLYMSHVPDPDTPFEETMSALANLQAQRKIKDIGVSNVSLEQLQEYNKTGLVKFVQNRFSLLNRSFDPDFIAYCEEQGIGIIPYQVIERGLLTDKAVEGIELREGDLRHKKPEFVSEVRQVIGRWVGEHLEPIAEDLETSVSALAIWWALQQPAIAFCIVGATEEAQVVSNLRAVSLDPPDDTLERINTSCQALADEIDRNYGKSVREFMGLA